MNGQSLISFHVVHIIRGSKLVLTIPTAFSQDVAEAYQRSFNASEKARSHSERAVIVKQSVLAELPHEVDG